MAGKSPILTILKLGLVMFGGVGFGGLYVFLSRRPLVLGSVSVPAWLYLAVGGAVLFFTATLLYYLVRRRRRRVPLSRRFAGHPDNVLLYSIGDGVWDTCQEVTITGKRTLLYEESMEQDAADAEAPGPFQGVATVSKRRLRKLLDTLERARPYLERPRTPGGDDDEEDEACYSIHISGPSFSRTVFFSLRSDLRDDNRHFRRFVDTIEELCGEVTNVTEPGAPNTTP